jgi:hypothetical protein
MRSTGTTLSLSGEGASEGERVRGNKKLSTASRRPLTLSLSRRERGRAPPTVRPHPSAMVLTYQTWSRLDFGRLDMTQ